MVPKLNLKNANTYNYFSKDYYQKNETTKEKEKAIENIKKNIITNNKNTKKQNIKEKKAKEIFLMKSSGKKIKIYKADKNI